MLSEETIRWWFEKFDVKDTVTGKKVNELIAKIQPERNWTFSVKQFRTRLKEVNYKKKVRTDICKSSESLQKHRKRVIKRSSHTTIMCEKDYGRDDILWQSKGRVSYVYVGYGALCAAAAYQNDWFRPIVNNKQNSNKRNQQTKGTSSFTMTMPKTSIRRT